MAPVGLRIAICEVWPALLTPLPLPLRPGVTGVRHYSWLSGIPSIQAGLAHRACLWPSHPSSLTLVCVWQTPGLGSFSIECKVSQEKEGPSALR